jgi:hypothetical protein
MRQSTLLYAGLALVAAGGAYFGSAYWAASSFVQAARDGDADKIASSADMPAIRKA